jgi:hypothetical protein
MTRRYRHWPLSALAFGLLITTILATSPVQAQEAALQASPQQVKAIEAWTETLAVQAAT